MKRISLAVSLLTVLVLAAPARAGSRGTDGAFNFRLGGFFPSGDSAFWKANEQAFTLDHSDFNGAIGGVGYLASINNYLEFGVGVDLYSETQRSADRNFTDQSGNPIFHDTRLSLAPVTVDVRFLPAGRYKQTGREGRYHVRRPVPYLGAGVGLDYWQYEETGDFVASDNSIVFDRSQTSGLDFEKHVMAGIEFPVAPNWNLTFEARQSWAKATPGGPFTTINPGSLDLGGTMVFVGGSIRF
jgi:opacity protein-like surface antigen